METKLITDEEKREVFNKINKIVVEFNSKIRENYNKQKIILELQELRAIYLKKYGIDINDYIRLCFDNSLNLICLMFKVKGGKNELEKI